MVLEAKNDNYFEHTAETSTKIKSENPLNELRKQLAQNHSAYHGFRFVGGLVGYFSYEVVRYIESLPNSAMRETLEIPDFQFGLYDDGIVFDHLTGQAYYYWYTKNRIREVEQLIYAQNHHSPKLSASKLKVNMSQSEFIAMVEKAKNYIKSGDIFQVVLSKRVEFEIEGELMDFYRALREINPSPYMYFLKMKDLTIIGSSPEMLGRVDGRRVETYPIAGTAPIGNSASENDKLANSLLSDPKERAEHVMLVDLARNDLGKICKFGSVDVPEFMTVQRYSHVQHIVSRVTGDLREGKDALDAFTAIFPAGTVSGAPKKRAMEIIDELEPSRRGPYAGAIGYFSYNGNADFAITIRTLVAKGQQAYLQAGAGIVADSQPKKEWDETEHKARPILSALKVE